jgi:hypothetical protein
MFDAFDANDQQSSPQRRWAYLRIARQLRPLVPDWTSYNSPAGAD